METLLNYSLEEIENLIAKQNEPKFRAEQIYNGLYLGKSFNEITTISQNLKIYLQQNFTSQPLSIIDTKISKDGTIKFIFKLLDNNVIESVLMKYEYGYSICVSSQVGCNMRCKFCASGLDGLVRNLSSGEILAQIILANKFLDGKLGEKRKITNIVIMGSGEPLDNYDNVTKFLKLVSHPKGFNISERNISLSTCGLVDKIYKLADDGFKVTLTISLHATNDQTRKSFMPIARRYTIKDILSACEYYYLKTKRRVVFEYTLIKDVNDSLNEGNIIKNLFKRYNMSYHFNIIVLNENSGISGLKSTGREFARKFVNNLNKNGISATVRRTMGQDIEGACGMLRKRFLENESDYRNDEE
ncbi:MAG: 23S rRNA (adenine(2503)-C(2))-methyltransferase RlmN [Clostridiales bacterium]|nr:23S rRNA (adenine(2503)-C(2))-methyltransferase RlmN [Clostridiales bacterium]